MKAPKIELAYLSLPFPLSCITFCLSYHLASPYPEKPGRYLMPVHLLYSIGSRPADANEECSESEVCSLPTRIAGRPYLGLPGPQAQLPLNTPGHTTLGQGHLRQQRWRSENRLEAPCTLGAPSGQL